MTKPKIVSNKKPVNKKEVTKKVDNLKLTKEEIKLIHTLRIDEDFKDYVDNAILETYGFIILSGTLKFDIYLPPNYNPESSSVNDFSCEYNYICEQDFTVKPAIAYSKGTSMYIKKYDNETIIYTINKSSSNLRTSKFVTELSPDKFAEKYLTNVKKY